MSVRIARFNTAIKNIPYPNISRSKCFSKIVFIKFRFYWLIQTSNGILKIYCYRITNTNTAAATSENVPLYMCTEHFSNLMKISAGSILDSQGCKVSLRGQWRLGPDCADAQADLSLRLGACHTVRIPRWDSYYFLTKVYHFFRHIETWQTLERERWFWNINTNLNQMVQEDSSLI